MRLSFIVISLCFACLGLELGLWGAMVPLISERLELSPLQISLFLLLVGISLVVAALLFPRLQPVFGSQKLTLIATPLYALGFAIVLLAPSQQVFFLGAIWTGLASGILDGAINFQAVEWERRFARKRLSAFHGMYTLGVMFGAGYWLLAKYSGLSHNEAIPPLLLAVIVVVLSLGKYLLKDGQQEQPLIEGGFGGLPFGLTVIVGLLIFVATTIEGGMIDWSALFLTFELEMHRGQAGVGVAIFAVCMTIGRFSGDWLVQRVSALSLLAWPVLCASLVLLVALVVQDLALTLVAFGCIGLALANVFPLLLRLLSAGLDTKNRVRAVARLIAFAYFGVISGPVALGLVAEYSSYAYTMLCIALLGMVFAVAIGWLLRPLLARQSKS